MVDISVIIQTYKRPQYLGEQLRAMKRQTIPPKEIIVSHIGNERSLDFDLQEIEKLVFFDFDFGTHCKFVAALSSASDFVAIFDDDTIPGEKWLENCYHSFMKQPGIYGTYGIRLSGDSYSRNSSVSYGGWIHNNEGIEEVDAIGQCWFLKYDYINFMFREELPHRDNGEDIFFSYSAQKYGQIKSYIPPHPKGSKEYWGSIKGKEYGTDKEALFLRDTDDHYNKRNGTVKELIDRGWKPLFMRG